MKGQPEGERHGDVKHSYQGVLCANMKAIRQRRKKEEVMAKVKGFFTIVIS